ncbi:MAG: serine/threonine-protein kinase [Rhodothermia bacterium]|nr:serine/threonine-protein kinase [Rhodothermia bacterium]
MPELSSEQWTLIRSVVTEAMGLPEQQRARFVSESIGDKSVQRYALDLLHKAATEGGFLDSTATAVARDFVSEAIRAHSEPTPHPGEYIGPYRIIRQIGRGGMGVVLLAEWLVGEARRQVAIKLVNRTSSGPGLLERFSREQQILASLVHPGIARLYDGGVTSSGNPYFVMEYVDGTPITNYCTGEDLALQERLQLFVDVCEVVDYAQRHLIVHRDLKPSNILVTAERRVKLLDFGIAKVIEPESGDATQTIEKVLTPAYAAPEQLMNGRITTATDVYALGVVLFEVVTGQLPYSSGSDNQVDLVRAICERPPLRASVAAIRRNATTQHATESDRKRSRALRGDVDAIIGHALRKNPAHRYPSAAAMGVDVQRHLDRKPVVARKGSRWYEVRRWAYRNKVVLSLMIFVLIVLVGASLFGGYYVSKLTQQRENARTIAEVLTHLESTGIPADALSEVDSLMVDVLSVKRDILEQHDPQILTTLKTLAEVHRRDGDIATSKAYLQRAIALMQESDTVDLADLNATTLQLAIDEAHLGDPDAALELVDQVWETSDHPRMEPWWHLAMYALNGALRDNPAGFTNYGGVQGSLTFRLDAEHVLNDLAFPQPPRFGVIGYWPGLNQPTALRKERGNLFVADLDVYAPIGVHITYSFFYWHPQTDSIVVDWSENRHAFRGTTALPVHVWGDATHGTSSRVVRVGALVDGNSRLVFADGRVFWHHIDGDAPGRFRVVETAETDYSEVPTVVAGEEWLPSWPDVPDRSNRDCNCLSSSVRIGEARADPGERPVEVRTISGRNGVRLVVWEPDSLVIEFDDPWAGWDYYETELVIAQY